MNNTLPRVRAGQPVTDDGSCWRSIAERQQALIDRDSDSERLRAMYATQQVAYFSQQPGYTAGAVEAMDAGDPHPGPVQMYFPEPVRVSGWLLFVAGVMCGAVACAWVML